MKTRLTMIFASLFLCLGTALAQTEVNGTVVSSEDGQPVIGASIQAAGTNIGVVTDLDGKFSLTMPKGKTVLRVSYVGMETVEVVGKRNMRIVLNADQTDLDEVMVVAYGTAKKSSFTGSADNINGEKLELRPISNVAKGIEGQATGVQVTSASGQPGSAPSIRIRGYGSINASSTPLYVVDGIPYDGSLSSLNPSDIESMTILKDASAGALYGARGANGVVMITTRRVRRARPT